MNFINIVSERYNGQYISYFNINKGYIQRIV